MEWWLNLLEVNRCLLIGCALGAPDEGVFMSRMALELTGAEAGAFEFESDQVYDDIAHFVGEVNTWRYVEHASYRKRGNDEPGPACLVVENIDDESFDITGIRNGHLTVRVSDGVYGHVIGRPHNYAEALAWVTANVQS
jgi:hypothetical protein